MHTYKESRIENGVINAQKKSCYLKVIHKLINIIRNLFSSSISIVNLDIWSSTYSQQIYIVYHLDSDFARRFVNSRSFSGYPKIVALGPTSFTNIRCFYFLETNYVVGIFTIYQMIRDIEQIIRQNCTNGKYKYVFYMID